MFTKLSRKTDILFILAMDIIAGLLYKLFVLIKPNDKEFYVGITSKFDWYTLAAIGGLFIFVTFIGYLEARGNDAYVTGNTQRMGVVNSFTSMPAVTLLASRNLGFIVSCLITSIGLFIARELGRKSYHNRQADNNNKVEK